MKRLQRPTLLQGSGAGLAAISLLQTSVSFLLSRDQVISLLPMAPSPNPGYIWRKVFLKAKGEHGTARTDPGYRGRQ